jgi:hypothetical protein
MRVQPLMRVEVDGKVVTRPGVLEVLQYGRDGKPTVSRMRPQLGPGEILRERAGTIPVISKGPDVTHVHDVYRHQIVRAVLGEHPAILSKEADPVALTCLCRRLVDAQKAMELLRANGCGRYSDSLADMVRVLLGPRE